jgi:hypothetical protein
MHDVGRRDVRPCCPPRGKPATTWQPVDVELAEHFLGRFVGVCEDGDLVSARSEAL